MQLYKGILRDKTIGRHILNDDKQKHHCCRLQLLVEKFGDCSFKLTKHNLIKVNKALSDILSDFLNDNVYKTFYQCTKSTISH